MFKMFDNLRAEIFLMNCLNLTSHWGFSVTIVTHLMLFLQYEARKTGQNSGAVLNQRYLNFSNTKSTILFEIPVDHRC